MLKLNPIGFVSGKYGSASLSLAQILLWTILVFSSSFYVLVASGKLLALSDQVLILLGIAGTSSVIAKIAASVKDEKGREIAGSEKNERDVIADPKWLDLFKSEGRPDLYKFQMALFTALAAFFVVGKIYRILEFPELPASLITLIGISNGIYLTAKATSPTLFEKLAETDRQLQEARKEHEKRAAELTEAVNLETAKEKELNKAKEQMAKAEDDFNKETSPDQKIILNQLIEQLKAALPKAEDEYKKASEKRKVLEAIKRTAKSREDDLQNKFDKRKEEINGVK